MRTLVLLSALLAACLTRGQGAEPMQAKDDTQLSVEARRTPAGLAWKVENTGKDAVWAWLLVPSIVDGRSSLAVDTAWTAVEGDLLVLRKVDTPVPEDRDADRINAGAVRLGPGESRAGEIALASPVPQRVPYGRPSAPTVTPRKVALEVGWAPDAPDLRPAPVVPGDPRTAWISSEDVPGGQRLARSAAVDW